jgi:protein-disulfide isomerase
MTAFRNRSTLKIFAGRRLFVTRRILLIALVLLALFAGRVLMIRGTRPALAAHTASNTVSRSSSETNARAADSRPADNASSNADADPFADPAKSSESPRNYVSQQPAQQSSGVPDIDSHKAYGSKNAPVTMEVFSDYQCPACRTLYTTTNRQLMDNYVSTGKVYLIHRDFPLPMHAHSKVAASYARAAAHIGKSEAVEQVLFENQSKWEQTGDIDGTIASVLSPAEMNKIRAMVKAATLEPLIAKDLALGQTYAVNQTPTTIFHAKGQTYPYAGVMNYEILKQFLDQLLSQK